MFVPGFLFLPKCQVGRRQPQHVRHFAGIVDIHAGAILENILGKGWIRSRAQQKPGFVQNPKLGEPLAVFRAKGLKMIYFSGQ